MSDSSLASGYTDAIDGALATWSWRGAWEAWKDGRLTLRPVRISLYKPRFWPVAEAFPYVRELAPDASMLNFGADDRRAGGPDRFEADYRQKLDRTGVEAIRARLHEVAEQVPIMPLVRGFAPSLVLLEAGLALLCFEADPQQCHRSIFARWWQEQTGAAVPEVGLTIEAREPKR